MLSQVERAVTKEAAVTPVLMAYTAYGEKNPGKSPLILLHGLFNKRGQWETVARKMAKATGGEVIAADLRNHGDSPWTGEFSHKHITADVHHLIQHVGAQNAHVLGHGFSGRSVVQTALEKPEIIKSVVVSESTPFGIPTGYWRLATVLRSIKDIPVLQNSDVEAVRKDMDEKLRPKIRSALMRKLFLSNLKKKDSGETTWHFNLNSLLNNLESACPIPNFRPDSVSNLPALFVCGEASDSLPKYHLQALVNLFPKVTIAYAGGAGYRLYQDRPGFFSEFISEFVNKH